MRAILGALVLAAAVALPACQYCVEDVAPRPVTDQPLGARCGSAWSGGGCVDGLECLARTCTVPCATSPDACPAASVCVEAARDEYGNPLLMCLPACVVDADCQLGATVGQCFVPGSGYCIPRRCTTDDECAGLGRCVGVSEARGITWNDYCEDGFCQL